jgi:hypothetical protein
MFCIVTVVRVHVLYFNSATFSCFVFLQCYVYILCIVTMVSVNACIVIFVSVHVLFCGRGTREDMSEM